MLINFHSGQVIDLGHTNEDIDLAQVNDGEETNKEKSTKSVVRILLRRPTQDLTEVYVWWYDFF